MSIPGVDPRRVAQLCVEYPGGSRRGSGYRITDTAVLTAAHVVEDAVSVSVVFNADPPEEWKVSATVALRAPAGDVAVLTIDPPAGQRGVESAPFGRLDRRADRLECRMVGFPLFKLRDLDATPYRDSHQADGTIGTLSNSREGTIEITVEPPRQDPTGQSPWEGMSGAAVWCADLIVGVVSRHYLNEGPNRLSAVRVTRWYEELDADELITLRDLLGLPDQGGELADVILEVARRRAATSQRRTRLRLLDKEREDDVARWFVAPPGWDDAVSALRSSGIVLLRGEVGSGRRTAAVRLLGENRRARPIEQLSPKPDEDGGACLDPADVAEGDRLLLDLSGVDNDRLAAITEELLGFRRTVRDLRAVLVIVLPARTEHHLVPELGALEVEVGRPDGRKVFEAHLSAQGVRSEGSERVERLLPVLERGSMAEIASLARLVNEARKRSASATFAEWLNEALAAHSDRAVEVAKQVAQRADGHFRAMLLASAMLEGHGADDVFKAQRLLLQWLKFDAGIVHELEQRDLSDLFAEIGVEVDSHVIRFAKLNYAEAVRKHFWTNFPSLRDCFRDWVIQCGCRMRFPGGQGERFVRHYGEECLRVGRPSDLKAAVEKWATEDRAKKELASTALEFGLTDVREGWRFRKECYEWSRDPRLAVPLAEVVIGACVDVIAPSYPSQAVVRLHHLVRRHHDDRVAQAARVGLLALAEDPRFFRHLLARLTDPAYGRLDDARGRSVFLAAANPARLTAAEFGPRLLAEHIVWRQLVAGWAVVLSRGSRPEYEDYVWQCLDAHSTSHQDKLLSVLVEACRAEFPALATLFAIGRRWLAKSGEGPDLVARRQTIQRLDSGIDSARNEATNDEGRQW